VREREGDRRILLHAEKGEHDDRRSFGEPASLDVHGEAPHERRHRDHRKKGNELQLNAEGSLDHVEDEHREQILADCHQEVECECNGMRAIYDERA
jgi:hypothetical protein